MKIKIKNLGPIEEAKLDIKPLTIISGKNSTGKSFIAKSLYCVFNTLNKNYTDLQIKKHLKISFEKIFQQKNLNGLIRFISRIPNGL